MGRGDIRKPAGFYNGRVGSGEGRGGATTVGRVPEKVGVRALGGLLANKLLSALPGEDFERLLPALDPVSLSSRDKFDDSRDAAHVYFPEDSVVSHLVLLEDGSTVEAAMTGREGVVGLGAVFGQHTPSHWARVTLAGSALRMRADAFRREFAGGEALRALLLEHAGRHFAQVAQRAACIGRHRVEARLAVWLLMLHDRAGADELPLTQEFIARRLGTRRAGITEAAGRFQQRGLIAYSRGTLHLLDRPGLEAAACECYGALRD
ncbi:MAG TPA: Crp/Fnr family transcriptional regulator, partial [Pyrinomonadaceae bacterium]|nr:Crp/Fnr family transcriptional regulator [Pyrinomonadaceae bacterium]